MANAADLETLKQTYAEWDRSKGTAIEACLEIMAEDLQLRSVEADHEAVRFAGAATGRAAMERYLRDLTAAWTMVHFTPEVYLTNEDSIAMFGVSEWRFNATGKTAASPVAHLWRFRDGKAVEFREVLDSQRLVSAAI